MYGPYGTDLAFTFAITCDESYNLGQYSQDLYTYDAGDGSVKTVWGALYNGIELDNVLIQGIDNLSPGAIDDSTRDIIKGQSLFLRGYFYDWLVTLWGDVPLITQPTGSITGNLTIARTPKAQVYAQILSDMKTADSLFALRKFTVTKLGYAEKVTLEAAEGYLAKVCLQMASAGPTGTPVDVSKYNDAITWANTLISDPNHVLNPDYTQIFKNLLQDKYDTKESIWEAGLYGTNANEGSSFTYYVSMKNSPGGTQGNTFITQKLYYAYGPWDTVRQNWNCPAFYYKANPTTFAMADASNLSNTNLSFYTNLTNTSWYIQPGKWRRIYELASTANGGSGQGAYNGMNIPLLRLADVYLMKAEAVNESAGPTADAYNAINAVRRRAFKVSATAANAVCDLPAGLSQGAFRDSLRAERMREFCFEGVRKWDEIRWGSFVADMKGINALATATLTSASAPAGSGFSQSATNGIIFSSNNVSQKHLLFPIPNTELQLNSALTQNPGW